MNAETIAHLVTSAVDSFRAQGEESTALMIERFAPLIGALVAARENGLNSERASFVAHHAAQLLNTFVDFSDGDENAAVRRAVKLARLVWDTAQEQPHA